MLLFCPHCSSILRITSPSGANRFECQTCTYICPIRSNGGRFFEEYHHTRKEVEDVIGGPQAWANAQKMDVLCPGNQRDGKDSCDGGEAMFYQLQIRSADEPMSTFYKCTKCLKEWREG